MPKQKRKTRNLPGAAMINSDTEECTNSKIVESDTPLSKEEIAALIAKFVELKKEVAALKPRAEKTDQLAVKLATLEEEVRESSIAVRGLPPILFCKTKDSSCQRPLQHLPAIGVLSSFCDCDFDGDLNAEKWDVWTRLNYTKQTKLQISSEEHLDYYVLPALEQMLIARCKPAIKILNVGPSKQGKLIPNFRIYRKHDIVGGLHIEMACGIMEDKLPKNELAPIPEPIAAAAAQMIPEEEGTISEKQSSAARHDSTVKRLLLDLYPDYSDPMNNKWVFGQVFNYLQELQFVHGVKHPFGILSTWNEWRVCWLQCAHNVAQEKGSRITENNIQEVLECFYETKQYKGTDFDDVNKEAVAMTEKLTKELEEKAKTAEKPVQDRLTVILETANSVVPRVLLVSNIIKREENNILINSLASALIKMLSNKTPHLDIQEIIKDPSILRKMHLPCLGKQGDAPEVSAKADIGVLKWGCPPASNVRQYYLLRSFGSGRDSKQVWAVLAGSTIAVMKFRVKEDLITAENLVNEEAKNWNRIYGENYGRSVKIYDEWAVVMPYFAPYAGTVFDENWKTRVQECLKKWAKARCYHRDVDPKHVGFDEKGNAWLFDLSDVEFDQDDVANRMWNDMNGKK